MSRSAADTEPPWGMHLNVVSRPRTSRPTVPEGYPAWGTPIDIDAWLRRGVVVWDTAVQRIYHLLPEDALTLLDSLRATDSWHDAGISLIGRHPKLLQPAIWESPGSGDPAPDQSATAARISAVWLQLSADASAALFELLTANEARLRTMAAEDDAERSRSLQAAYGVLFGLMHTREAKELDVTTRPYPWTYDAETQRWTCDDPPNRATVFLTRDRWFWQGCIEQPECFKHERGPFLKLTDALGWAEEQLTAIRAAASSPPEPEAEEDYTAWTPGPQLQPFWIDPAALEPTRITYRVVIDLEYTPSSYETMELSFGKQWRYHERYLAPAALARELRLDAVQLQIEQPLGPNHGWYQLRSRVTYYQHAAAHAQAQQVWDGSAIVQRYQQGALIQAHYGVEEVETAFCEWIGGCEDPARPWRIGERREDYRAHEALRLTLLHALDLDGFRALLRIKRRWIADDELLRSMHEQRAASPYLPAAAREASVRWLQQHPHDPATSRRKGPRGR